MMTAANNTLLLSTEGVFIHVTTAQADEDVLISGHVFVWQKAEGVFVEWKASDELEGATKETGWTLVPDGSMPDGSTSVCSAPPGSTSQNGAVKQKSTHQKYIINFDIKDLKCFKRSKPQLGWSYLIFILKCGTTYPALHFHHGGTKTLITQLKKHLNIKSSAQDACLYLVRDHDPQALSKSFDELQLFEKDQAGDIITKFIQDPYSATIGGFSRVTHFLRDTLLATDPLYQYQRATEELNEVNDSQHEVTGLAVKPLGDSDFEMVTAAPSTVTLPAMPEVTRSAPVTSQQWSGYMDDEGKVTNIHAVKDAIFRGGVEPTIRTEVWKFLLGYYKWNSTYKSRTEQRKLNVDHYFRMKLQWKSIDEDQESRFSDLRDRKSLIDKDVMRTDRTHAFFQGENNANISVLYDILLTHCMYNFDLGYVQGMSDLLAPILVVMENEVDAFWCFAGLIKLVGVNFDKDQQAMKNQLSQVQTLLTFIDPQLANYLESQESSNMYFCFRWLLITFKREFSFPDIMRLWEVIWTGRPCQNLHLLLCIAILIAEKTLIIENNFGFTEILKHINDMSMNIHVEEVLMKGEGLYLQLRDCRDLPLAIHNMLGLSSRSDDSNPFNPAIPADLATDEHSSQTDETQAWNQSPSRTAENHVTQSLHVDSNKTSPHSDDSSIEILSETGSQLV